MKNIVQHNPEDSMVRKSSECLNINGIRKLITLKFINKELEIARDLWLMSFYLMGLDIREILTATPDEIMKGVFLSHSPSKEQIPLPLVDEAYEIFLKYSGTYYALNIIEKDSTPSFKEAQNKANRIGIIMNNKLAIIRASLNLKCPLLYEDVSLTWVLNNKDANTDNFVINKMRDFVVNNYGLKNMNESIERIAEANRKFLDFVLYESAPKEKKYPIKCNDGSLILYED
jgi:hypothetical protein